MRLPFSPMQTAVGVGVLVVLVLLILIVMLVRRARAKARRRARTEAALGTPNPSSTLPAPEPPTIKASPPRYPPSAQGVVSQPFVQVERDPTEPIPTGQQAPAGLVDGPPDDAERNGTGTYPSGQRPSEDSSTSGTADRPKTAPEGEPRADSDQAESDQEEAVAERPEPESAGEPESTDEPEAAVKPEPGTAERAVARTTFAVPVVAAAEVVRRADATPVTDAKDRLLRVLLTDPDRALHAVGDLEACRQRLDKLHRSMHEQRRLLADAARRLRGAGLTPAQVARLAGFGEGEMVSLLAEHAPSPVPRAPRPKLPPAADDSADAR